MATLAHTQKTQGSTGVSHAECQNGEGNVSPEARGTNVQEQAEQ